MAAKANKIEVAPESGEVIDINEKRNAIAVAVEDTAKSESVRVKVAANVAEALAEAKRLGASYADGTMSLTDLAMLLNQLCRDRIAFIGKAGDIAESLYITFANAQNLRAAERGGVDFIKASAKESKSAITLFRSFGKPEVCAQGEDWFKRVLSVKDALGADCKLSGYNALAKANRSVVAESAKLIGNRAMIADDSDIMDWIMNKPADDKPAHEVLQKILNDMRALSKDSEGVFLRSALGEDVLAVMQQFSNVAQTWIDTQVDVL